MVPLFRVTTVFWAPCNETYLFRGLDILCIFVYFPLYLTKETIFVTSSRSIPFWKAVYNMFFLGGRVVLLTCCVSCHRGIQQILAYSWARPAILVAGKGRGVMVYFFYFFTFIRIPISSLSLIFIFSTIYSISFSPFLWETTQNDPQRLTCC